MQKSFDTSVSKTQAILEQIRADATDKRVLLRALKERGADMERSPYTELGASFDALAAHAKKSGDKVRALREARKQFRDLGQGKKKITSKSADYARVDQLKAQVQTLMPELEASVKAYEAEAKVFVSLVEKHRIGKIHVHEIRRQLAGFLKELDASMAQVRINVIRVQKTRERGKVSGNADALYDQIAKKLAMIEKERFEIANLIDQFDREVGRQTTLVVGPGFMAHDIMTVLESRAKTIRGFGQEIAALAKQLPQ